jgi:VanZ family protein
MESATQRFSDTAWEKVLLYWAPALGYAATIFYLSSLPNPHEQLPTFLRDLSDKFLHIVEYGILGALWYRTFRWASGPRVAASAVLLAIVAGSIYGATDELHQAFVPLRESSVFDWIADTIGSVIGARGLSWVEQRRCVHLSSGPVDQTTPVP